MELEVSKDKLLRENERESLMRQSRIDKENIQDLQTKIENLNRWNQAKHQYKFLKNTKTDER